jgi:hypothetical protein
MLLFLTTHGFGRHTLVTVLSYPSSIDTFNLVFLTSDAFYQAGLFGVKYSILFFYLRLFPHQRLRWACFGMMGFLAAFAAVILAVVIIPQACMDSIHIEICTEDLGCATVRTLLYTDCVKAAPGFTAYLANSLTDLTILCLPLPVVWRLPAAGTLRKIQMTAVFGLGGFVFVASIMRMVSLVHLDPWDNAWDLVNDVLWTVGELSTGIVAACLPITRPVWSGGVKKLGIGAAEEEDWQRPQRVPRGTDAGEEESQSSVVHLSSFPS